MSKKAHKLRLVFGFATAVGAVLIFLFYQTSYAAEQRPPFPTTPGCGLRGPDSAIITVDGPNPGKRCFELASNYPRISSFDAGDIPLCQSVDVSGDVITVFDDFDS